MTFLETAAVCVCVCAGIKGRQSGGRETGQESAAAMQVRDVEAQTRAVAVEGLRRGPLPGRF